MLGREFRATGAAGPRLTLWEQDVADSSGGLQPLGFHGPKDFAHLNAKRLGNNVGNKTASNRYSDPSDFLVPICVGRNKGTSLARVT